MPLPQRIINTPFLFAGFMIKKLYFRKKGLGKEYEEGLREGRSLGRSASAKKRAASLGKGHFLRYCRIELSLFASLFRRR